MKMTIEERNEIKSMLKHGLRGYEIAEQTGRSEATITKIRKELQEENFQIWHTKGGLVSSSF